MVVGLAGLVETVEREMLVDSGILAVVQSLPSLIE